MYKDTTCRVCNTESEDTNHIVNQCPGIQRDDTIVLDIETENLDTIKEIVTRIKTFMDKCQ